jgi:hypothetical protein
VQGTVDENYCKDVADCNRLSERGTASQQGWSSLIGLSHRAFARACPLGAGDRARLRPAMCARNPHLSYREGARLSYQGATAWDRVWPLSEDTAGQ